MLRDGHSPGTLMNVLRLAARNGPVVVDVQPTKRGRDGDGGASRPVTPELAFTQGRGGVAMRAQTRSRSWSPRW